MKLRRIVPPGDHCKQRLRTRPEMPADDTKVRRVGVFRLAAFQGTELAEIQQVVDLLWTVTAVPRSNEPVDVGLAADNVKVLLCPVGHG